MTIINLYKYKITNGWRITPRKPEERIEYIQMFRISADEGNGLTRNGSEPVTVIDTDTFEGWEEVPAPDLWIIFNPESEAIK